ncbi:hypothetical protein OROHE_022356 [Orobanche hederae]
MSSSSLVPENHIRSDDTDSTPTKRITRWSSIHDDDHSYDYKKWNVISKQRKPYCTIPDDKVSASGLLLSQFVNVEKADFVLVNAFNALEVELFTFFNHTFFVKRVGCSICLRQFDSREIEWIHPFDSPKPFRWKSYAVELLKMDGYGWSVPFSVDTEGTMFILLRSESKLDEMNLRVEVRSATKSSRYEVIFRPNFFSSCYRATMGAVDETVQLICCLCESTLALKSLYN